MMRASSLEIGIMWLEFDDVYAAVGRGSPFRLAVADADALDLAQHGGLGVTQPEADVGERFEGVDPLAKVNQAREPVGIDVAVLLEFLASLDHVVPLAF